MPCGGIYSVPPSPHNTCFQCNGGGGDLFVEEWDAHLHRECLGAFLQSEEGKIVIAHGHAIQVDAVRVRRIRGTV